MNRTSWILSAILAVILVGVAIVFIGTRVDPCCKPIDPSILPFPVTLAVP
jgi:hypothetical protein